MDPKEILVLQLQTLPAVCMSNEIAMSKGLTRYRKELVKVGNFFKATTGQAFKITEETIDHWIMTFNRWIANGNHVPIPLGHAAANEPEKNQGWVHMLWRENDTLIGVLELLDPKLALTTDVSICVQGEVIDGRGQKYVQPITHVALCTDPVIPGLGKFEKLSLSKGDNEMDKKVLAKLLDIAEDASDELITNTITGLKVPATVLEASQAVLGTVDPLLMKVVAENRTGKLNTLVNAGIITPAIKDLIAKKCVESTALTLSLSKGGDDGFDLLVEVLTKNTSTEKLLSEVTGPQILELANTQQNTPNVLQSDINRRRQAAGMKN